MKKLLCLLLMMLLLGGCVREREDYYIFSFGDYTITPGYDDVAYARLIFDAQLSETIEPETTLKEQELYFWGKYLADIDITNDSSKQKPIDQAIVSRFVFYLSNYPDVPYKINGIELSNSVKENCEMFSGEYIERNGYACAFGQEAGDKDNVVVLYGDLFAIDQDKLDHVEIYVE